MATFQLLGWEITVAPQADFPNLPFLVHQAHGGTIIDLAQTNQSAPDADGILINRQQYAGIKTADCLPLILLTGEQALLLHVSRKTVLANQLDHVPKYLPISDIQAVFLGPHICGKHFIFEHVGPEIVAFQKRWSAAVREETDGLHLSLDLVVQAYFQKWGVSGNIIRYDKRCTFETADLPSYRRLFHANQLNQMFSIITAVRAVEETGHSV